MKDEDIKLDMCVRHKETGTELVIEYYHEHDKLWVATDELGHDWFFEADDVELAGPPPQESKAHSNNITLSTNIHNDVPSKVREIVNGHLDQNESLKCQHNLEVLDEIIKDLKQYQDSLPSISDIECVGAL